MNKHFGFYWSFILSFVLLLLLYKGFYGFWMIFLWILSLNLYVNSVFQQKDENNRSWTRLQRLILCTFLSLPVLVRVINIDPQRIHGDEFILGEISSGLDLWQHNFFAPLPENPAEWTAQYPGFFNVLQKLFFLIFGKSIVTVKLSILPYVLITTTALFLTVKKILGHKTAIVSIFLYSFFAISLYHETLGISVIAGTAAFMGFFYLLTSYLIEPKRKTVLLMSVVCGLCYLSYFSAYISGPIAILVFLILIISTRKLKYFQDAILFAGGVVVTILPFIAHAAGTDNYYFLNRPSQVSLMNGFINSHGINRQIAYGLIDNTLLSLQSLYINGIGGGQGYFFGHLALFEPMSLIIFLLGVAGVFFAPRYRIIMAYILFTITVSFFSSMAFTVPPPSYHRLSAVFPLIVIVMSIPFFYLLERKEKLHGRTLIIIVVLCAYGFLNQRYFLKAAGSDAHEEVKIARYIDKFYPNRKIYIASFPTFHMGKVFRFFNNQALKNVTVDYHDHLLGDFNNEEKYVYVILFPNDYEKQFAARDKNGTILKGFGEYSLFVN